nr:MAG TPA: integrase [Caudoviricetes sp.]
MLLSEAIERYMRYMIERRDATETTDITYRSILRKLKRYMGDVDISKLTLHATSMQFTSLIADSHKKPGTRIYLRSVALCVTCMDAVLLMCVLRELMYRDQEIERQTF